MFTSEARNTITYHDISHWFRIYEHELDNYFSHVELANIFKLKPYEIYNLKMLAGINGEQFGTGTKIRLRDFVNAMYFNKEVDQSKDVFL